MTVIEVQALTNVRTYLPQIAKELKRIADSLESNASKKTECCFCGEEINGYGNNPWPLLKDDGKRCCDKCNSKVLEARMNEIRKGK